MSDEQPILDPFQFKSFKLELTNNLLDRTPDWPRTLSEWRNDPITIEAHITIPRAAYTDLLGRPPEHAGRLPEPLYTVEWSTDLNPWHRAVIGRRAWLKRLRDGMWWTFRRRVLRRELFESAKVTIPNCRVTSEPS